MEDSDWMNSLMTGTEKASSGQVWYRDLIIMDLFGSVGRAAIFFRNSLLSSTGRARTQMGDSCSVT
jgi:hypothetical protein